MRHEPCTPVCDFEHPVKLVGAHALLAGTKQVIGQQPFAQGNVGILEDRPYGNGELLTASGTLPHAFANVLALAVLFSGLWLQFISVVFLATMRADRTIGPAQLFDKFPRLIFIAKVLSQS